MNASDQLCAPTADAVFGPVVEPHCRDGFDFTLVFEQSVFVILPASLLILAAPLRLVRLRKSSIKVAAPRLRLLKLAVMGCLAALQLSLIALWATHHGSTRLNTVSLAAACVSFASSLMSCALSYAEHAKSPRPSSLLNVFLFVSLLLDSAVLRTVWLLSSSSSSSIGLPIRVVFLSSFILKAVLLVLEAKEKSGDLVVEAYAPEETSGLYSRAVYAWIAPLLRTGFRRLLQPADLFALDERMSASTLNERFWWHWNKAPFVAKAGKHRLVVCCFLTLQRSLVAVIIPRLALLAFTICQPLVLTRFLTFLDDTSQPIKIGYGLVGAYALVYFGIAVTQALYWHQNGRSVTMMRGLLVSAIFSKVTEIRITAIDNLAAVTLMSSDVDVITRAMRQIHEFWANIIQLAIGTWLLSNHIGYAAAGPIIVAILALLATTFVSPLAKEYQVRWLGKTQKRVGITSAMIGHIKSIKISGLSQKLSDTIAALRVQEITASRPFRTIGALTSSIAQVPLLLAPVVAFAMFQGVSATTGQELDARRLFAALALITLLAQPLFWIFEVVLDLSAAFGAFGRIQKFLLESTRVEYREMSSWKSSSGVASNRDGVEMQPLSATSRMPTENSDVAIQVQKARFSWSLDRVILGDINLTLNKGQLAMLIGPVASGKTTLLKGLLGETPEVSGRVYLADNRLSWCDQSPWIQNQTIRGNITGYFHFDQNLYDQVIKACELQPDLSQLPQGDETVVGSNGLALSGGQKQRIALARAIYSRPKIALFDDIFSGLDNDTSKRIFSNLFARNGLLRQWRTTVVLATQSVDFLEHAEMIIALGKNGRITEQGTMPQLLATRGYVQSLVTDRKDVQISEASNISESEVDSGLSKREYKAKKAAADNDDKRRQLGDSTVYRYYFGSIGASFLITLLGLEVVWAFIQSFPTVWLKFWTDANNNSTNHKSGYYLGIYAALQVIGVLWFALLIWFVLVVVGARSSISLHQKLLSAVIGAPLSLFTTTDLGSITTRFSQDIGILDNSLPLALVITLASFLTLFAKAGLIASSSYYVAIGFPFLGALYYFLQRGYLRTSRQLRLLDLEEKAPVYTQFLEVLSGLATLRAFGWSDAAIIQNHQLVDRSQKPFYLLIMVQRWLILVLDLTTTVLALLVVGFAVKLRGSVSVGLTGVSLVQLISLSETLNMLIQFWTSIETSIGAVARIKQFSEETPKEEDLPLLGENCDPPADWPSNGHVVISNLVASYDQASDIKALNGITLELQPGEKIGICGRTGSGKSSLFLTLLRLLDLSSGAITIDSIPIASLPRETIRKRLITVSQDQFVLPGTLRENIDPFNTSSTEAIVDALISVDLWTAISACGGLDVAFEEEVLSHGQKQLFFLARAILKRSSSRLVLLDEASSSLDQHTEEMVHEVIRAHFKEHTVISIVHRLESILDFDRVIVLEKGRVVEIGKPRELLTSMGGAFKALWEVSQSNTWRR